MNKKYRVTLTDQERSALYKLVTTGKGAARRLAHARILLKADLGLGDEAIAQAVEVSIPTVERVRRRFVEEGLTVALDPRHAETPRPHKLNGEQEAHLIALACSTPPDGQARWSLRLLADRLVALEIVDTVSHETVRRTLKKTNYGPGSAASG
jgi:transposase